jgi:4,5-DOPA dioxygenase extradiol
MTRAPVLFVSHGAPTVALDPGEYGVSLARFAAAFPRPKAIVAVSAHFIARGALSVTSAPRNRIVHDFGGFPRPLYELDWPAPGAPEVAARASALLTAAGFKVALDPARRLDHGVWIPLGLAFPKADVPTVEVSLVDAEPAGLARMGTALAPLRDEGILLVASGGVVHNLARVRLGSTEEPEAWAVRFDAWVADRVAALDLHGLARFREDGPGADLAHPTWEHLAPIFVALGAGLPGDRVETVHQGILHGSLSMRSFALRSSGDPAAPHRSTSDNGKEQDS